jgi:hypothetical protein
MNARSSAGAATVLTVASLLDARAAEAQVHWDVGAQVGVMERVQTGAGAGAPSPTPGPVGEVHAHVALVPMVRVGPYLAHDISPVDGAPARQITEGGLRAKLAPPLFGGPWRGWGALGLGYARAYEPAHHVVVGAVDTAVGASEGGIVDAPLALGLAYRVRGPGDPWEISAELGCRFGLAFVGAMYDAAPRDSFALSLTVGVSLDE